MRCNPSTPSLLPI